MCYIQLRRTVVVVVSLITSCTFSRVLECLTSFLELVVAGIAGSPHMISATIISVSRVVYEFRSEYSTGINNRFCQLFGLKSPSVVWFLQTRNSIHFEFSVVFQTRFPVHYWSSLFKAFLFACDPLPEKWLSLALVSLRYGYSPCI